MLPVDHGEEWVKLGWLVSAWAKELADNAIQADGAIQLEGSLWTYLVRDVMRGLFDDSEPLTNGSPSLRVIDRRNRQVQCVKGWELHSFLRPMANNIFVTKEAMLSFARQHGLPPPSCFSDRTKAAIQPSRSPEELKPAPRSVNKGRYDRPNDVSQLTRSREELKPASETMIIEAIRYVYAAAETAGDWAPNIKELIAPTQRRLAEKDRCASGNQIQKIGEKDEFKSRRGKPGQTRRSKRLK